VIIVGFCKGKMNTFIGKIALCVLNRETKQSNFSLLHSYKVSVLIVFVNHDVRIPVVGEQYISV
jgi:hypothetical protein